jgi:hypothetical protein
MTPKEQAALEAYVAALHAAGTPQNAIVGILSAVDHAPERKAKRVRAERDALRKATRASQAARQPVRELDIDPAPMVAPERVAPAWLAAARAAGRVAPAVAFVDLAARAAALRAERAAALASAPAAPVAPVASRGAFLDLEPVAPAAPAAPVAPAAPEPIKPARTGLDLD